MIEWAPLLVVLADGDGNAVVAEDGGDLQVAAEGVFHSAAVLVEGQPQVRPFKAASHSVRVRAEGFRAPCPRGIQVCVQVGWI